MVEWRIVYSLEIHPINKIKHRGVLGKSIWLWYSKQSCACMMNAYHELNLCIRYEFKNWWSHQLYGKYMWSDIRSVLCCSSASKFLPGFFFNVLVFEPHSCQLVNLFASQMLLMCSQYWETVLYREHDKLNIFLV